MSVTIFVWIPKTGSILNYFTYQLGAEKLVEKYFRMTLSVGHVSLQIDDEDSGESIYVSHRPDPNSGQTLSSDIQNQLADLKEICYEDDKLKRGMPTKNFKMNFLNERSMIQCYKNGTVKDGEFYSYHGIANNCSKVAYKLIRMGLMCDFDEETHSSIGDGACTFCRPYQYSKIYGLYSYPEKHNLFSYSKDRREDKIEKNFSDLRRLKLWKEANTDEFINKNKSKWITKNQAVDAVKIYLEAYIEKLEDKDKNKFLDRLSIISMPDSNTELKSIINDINDLMKSGARLQHLQKYLDHKISHMLTPSIILRLLNNIESKEVRLCFRKEKPPKMNSIEKVESTLNTINDIVIVAGFVIGGILSLKDHLNNRNKKI